MHLLVTRTERETRLNQRAKAIWLHGLSGSGKTTLATALESQLNTESFTTVLLDGDQIRSGLNRDLGFSDVDRAENLRRAAEAARLFITAGIIPVCAFITPLRVNRLMVREIIAPDDFLGVYLSASYEECARRDPKGLYRRAEKQQLKQFSGRDSRFEIPVLGEAQLVIDTGTISLENCVMQLQAFVAPHLRRPAGKNSQ